MGRNIWQSNSPVAMIKAVRAIVHGNADVNQAYDLFKELEKESPKQSKPKSEPQEQNKPQNKQKKTKSKKTAKEKVI